MSEQDLFIKANQALKQVVDQVKDDQWAMMIPEWFKIGAKQKDLTLRAIINYHAYDDAWVPDVLAGKTKDEVGDKFDGDLLGDDPKGNYAKYNLLASQAVEKFNELDKQVHLSYGDWSARDYLLHISSFRGFRTYDIAKLIGVDTKLPEELVQGMWELIAPHADEWRQWGVYEPRVEVAEGADLQAKLLAASGRSA
jgi:uncharacterized protein (TIGR03086 family)